MIRRLMQRLKRWRFFRAVRVIVNTPVKDDITVGCIVDGRLVVIENTKLEDSTA
jgi:hypothetical protein